MVGRASAADDKGDEPPQRVREDASTCSPAKGRQLYNGYTIGPPEGSASSKPATPRQTFYISSAPQASLHNGKPGEIKYPSTVRVPKGIAHLLPINVTNPATRKALRDGLAHLAEPDGATASSSACSPQDLERVADSDPDRKFSNDSDFVDDSDLAVSGLAALRSLTSLVSQKVPPRATSNHDKLYESSSVFGLSSDGCCHDDGRSGTGAESQNDESHVQSVEEGATKQESGYENENEQTDLNGDFEIGEFGDDFKEVEAEDERKWAPVDESEDESLKAVQQHLIEPTQDVRKLAEEAKAQKEENNDDVDSEGSESDHGVNMWLTSRRRGKHHKRARNPPPLVKKEDYRGDITIIVTSNCPISKFSSLQAENLVDYLQALLLSAYMAKRTLKASDWELSREFSPALRTRRTLVYVHFNQLLKQKLTCDGEKAVEHGRNLLLCGRGLPEDFEETFDTAEESVPGYAKNLKYARTVRKHHPAHKPWYLFAHFIFSRYVQPIQSHWPRHISEVKGFKDDDRPKNDKPRAGSAKGERLTSQTGKIVAKVQELRRSTRALGTIIDPPPPLDPYDERFQSAEDETDGNQFSATVRTSQAKAGTITRSRNNELLPGISGLLSDEDEPYTATTVPAHWGEKALIRNGRPEKLSRLDSGVLRAEATEGYKKKRKFPMPRAIGFHVMPNLLEEEESGSNGDDEHDDDQSLVLESGYNSTEAYEERDNQHDKYGDTDGDVVHPSRQVVPTSRASLRASVWEAGTSTSCTAPSNFMSKERLRTPVEPNRKNGTAEEGNQRLVSDAQLPTKSEVRSGKDGIHIRQTTNKLQRAIPPTTSQSTTSLLHKQHLSLYDGQYGEQDAIVSAEDARSGSAKPTNAGAARLPTRKLPTMTTTASMLQGVASEKTHFRGGEPEAKNTQGSIIAYASSFGPSTSITSVEQRLGRHDLINKSPVPKRRYDQITASSLDTVRKHRKLINSKWSVLIGRDGKVEKEAGMFVASSKKEIPAQPASRRISMSGKPISVSQASLNVNISNQEPLTAQPLVDPKLKDVEKAKSPVQRGKKKLSLAQYSAKKKREKEEREMDREEGEISG